MAQQVSLFGRAGAASFEHNRPSLIGQVGQVGRWGQS